jgi:hypothetical protein
MGLRGAHARPKATRWRSTDNLVITDEAIRIYQRMRAHEEREGPGGPVWWDMNKQLAKCLGLFGGMVCYEDPEWGDPRAFQGDIDRFFKLERAAARQTKQKYKYKWQR